MRPFSSFPLLIFMIVSLSFTALPVQAQEPTSTVIGQADGLVLTANERTIQSGFVRFWEYTFGPSTGMVMLEQPVIEVVNGENETRYYLAMSRMAGEVGHRSAIGLKQEGNNLVLVANTPSVTCGGMECMPCTFKSTTAAVFTGCHCNAAATCDFTSTAGGTPNGLDAYLLQLLAE